MSNQKLRILLLVAEPWRCDDGGGNTLDNFFNGMDAEFAQVYCSSMMPVNSCCTRYFQFTDGEVVRNSFTKRKTGHRLEISEQSEQGEDRTESSSLFGTVKKLRWESFLLIKQILWYKSNWKTEALREFITDFDPDVIYAPCYASPFQLAVTRWVKELTDKKILTWSADDNYSLRQFNLSPFFWLRRFWTRSCLRKTYLYYDAFYSISEDEAFEMEPVIGKKIDILRKSVPDGLVYKERGVHQPIRLIYAGGIYIERWKVLEKIGKALSVINADEVRCVLNIYTQNKLTERQKKALNDGKGIFCHCAVNQKKLEEIYSESDIALHVESQGLKNRLCTRLSFSTKIIDCLSSGCAVMAIAWKEQAGLKYLQKNDAAICITDEADIGKVLDRIVNNPEIIQAYAQKAYQLAMRNHNRRAIQDNLYNKLLELSASELKKERDENSADQCRI